MTTIYNLPIRVVEATETRYDHSHAFTSRTCQFVINEKPKKLCGKATKGYCSKGNWNRTIERNKFFCYQHRDKPAPANEPWGKCVTIQEGWEA